MIVLYIGNWGFTPGQEKGISRFAYDEDTGDVKLLDTTLPEVAAGQLALDGERGILYAVNECGSRKNEYGGGGEVLSLRIQADGSLTLMNRRDSLCPEPSYLALDGTGKYILTAHHCDPWHVTKLKRLPDGTLTNEVLFDDGSVVLYRLNGDGTVGDAVDALIYESCSRLDEHHQVNVDLVSGHIQLIEICSRLHSVVMSPDGKMFITCDKGLDKIYAFKLDRAEGRLYNTDCFEARWASFPRYSSFHPTLNVFYTNSELCPDVNTFRYDSEKGTMKHIGTASLFFTDPGLIDGKSAGAQDILCSADEKSLYVTATGTDSISVFSLDDQGLPTLRQVIPCGGKFPRGIALSPDGRFLLCGNMLSGTVSSFEVKADGTLLSTGKIFEAVSPSALKLFKT